MKHIKKFESFSNVNEELSFTDIRDWFTKNKDLVMKFVNDINETENPEIIKGISSLQKIRPEEKEEVADKIEDAAQGINENILRKSAEWVGKLVQYGAGAGIAGSLIRVMLADEGLISKVNAYKPAGVPIGLFIGYCVGALILGLVVSKIGQHAFKK